jgi:hypothetical protein
LRNTDGDGDEYSYKHADGNSDINGHGNKYADKHADQYTDGNSNLNSDGHRQQRPATASCTPATAWQTGCSVPERLTVYGAAATSSGTLVYLAGGYSFSGCWQRQRL